MLYFHRKDRGGILSCELLNLSYLLNGYSKPVDIEDWDKEVPDASDVLGEVLVTPYNWNTMGVVENGGPSLRSMVIITILNSVGYDVTGMPHESWSRKEIAEFMELGEEELNKRLIYLPIRTKMRADSDKAVKTR